MSGDLASFLDLVEVTAIGKLREYGISLKRIREIVLNTQHLLGVERPLVSARFRVGGKDIFIQSGESLVEVGLRRGQQAWDEVLGPFLQDLDYVQEVAAVWWPLGHAQPVQITPEFGFGFPVIADSGIRTDIIRERFLAQDPIDVIAKDFHVNPDQVEAALRYELTESA